VLLHDTVDDDHECPGRPADLYSRATECADEESGNYGGPKSAIGRDAACNRERDCKRQRDHSDDHSSDKIAKELLAVVIFEGGYDLWNKHIAQ
jgi:hypothetical protein